MKFKTLLLGTAAVLAVGGTARAADLAVAESVEYVKVCDAYGAGYFYVPGSDVCLKIGGFVETSAIFATGVGTNADGDSFDAYSADWKMHTRTSVTATAKWMTDWGAATVFVDYRAVVDRNNEFAAGQLAYLDTGYLKIGGLKAGWDASTFDWGFNGLIDNLSAFDHDTHQNQFQWSTTLGGMGFFLAAEDPRDNVGGSAFYTGNMPDIAAALTGSTGPISWKWSAAVTDTNYGTGWGTQLGVGWASGNNFLKIQAAVSNDAGAGYGANVAPNASGDTYWHVTGQGGIAWTSAFTTILGVGYASGAGVGASSTATNAWEAEAELDWQLAKGVQAGIDVFWLDPNHGGSTTTVEARVHAGF